MLAAEPKAASTAKASSSTRESVWDSSTSARLAYSAARTTTPRPPSVRDTCTLGTSGSSTLLLGLAMATSMLRWPGMKVTEMVGKTDAAPDTVRRKMSAEAVRRTVMDAWGTDGTVASATRMKPVEEALSSVSSRLVTGADAPSTSCIVTPAWSLSATVMLTPVWTAASPVKRGSALSSTCATVTPKEAPMSMSSSPMTTVTVTPVSQLEASRVTEAMAAPLALRSESWPAGRGAPLAEKEATGAMFTAKPGGSERRTVYEAPWPPSAAAPLTSIMSRRAGSGGAGLLDGVLVGVAVGEEVPDEVALELGVEVGEVVGEAVLDGVMLELGVGDGVVVGEAVLDGVMLELGVGVGVVVGVAVLDGVMLGLGVGVGVVVGELVDEVVGEEVGVAVLDEVALELGVEVGVVVGVAVDVVVGVVVGVAVDVVVGVVVGEAVLDGVMLELGVEVGVVVGEAVPDGVMLELGVGVGVVVGELVGEAVPDGVMLELGVGVGEEVGEAVPDGVMLELGVGEDEGDMLVSPFSSRAL